MAITTRRGDDGITDVIGGRCGKGSLRIEACGAVDELCCMVAHAQSHLSAGQQELRPELDALVTFLFSLTGDIARAEPHALPYAVGDDSITWLEGLIGRYEGALPPLAGFVMPTGTPAATALQLARTFARRAERTMVRLYAEGAGDNPVLAVCLNRLSDLLFLLGRRANHLEGVAEQLVPPPGRE